jgi:hypothetical protein
MGLRVRVVRKYLMPPRGESPESFWHRQETESVEKSVDHVLGICLCGGKGECSVCKQREEPSVVDLWTQY